jgi:hypothetical protein
MFRSLIPSVGVMTKLPAKSSSSAATALIIFLKNFNLSVSTIFIFNMLIFTSLTYDKLAKFERQKTEMEDKEEKQNLKDVYLS